MNYALIFDLQAPGGYVTNPPVLSQNVPYEKPLIEFEPLKDPEREGYVFMGWYADLSDPEPFEFTSETMPDTDLILHAKWQKEKTKYTVDFYEYYGGPLLMSQTVNEGEMPVDAVGYSEETRNPLGTFAGWRHHILEETSSSFEFNQPVYENIDVFATWSPGTVNIVYDAGEGTGVVPVNKNTYLPGNMVRILGGDELTGNNNQVFSGWLDENGNQYAENDLLELSHNVTLKAYYGAPHIAPNLESDKPNSVQSDRSTLSNNPRTGDSVNTWWDSLLALGILGVCIGISASLVCHKKRTV